MRQEMSRFPYVTFFDKVIDFQKTVSFTLSTIQYEIMQRILETLQNWCKLLTHKALFQRAIDPYNDRTTSVVKNVTSGFSREGSVENFNSAKNEIYF